MSFPTDGPFEPVDLPCNLFVELVTDYLDGVLTAEEVARVDAHLAICADCAEVLDQWRAVVELSGRLGEQHVDALSPATRRSLLAAFRRANGPGDDER